MVYGTSWGRKEISLPSTRQFVQWYPTAPTFLFPIRYSPCFEEELYSPGVIGCLSEAIHSLKDWGDLKQFSVCARFPLSLAVVDTKNPTVASWIWWQIKLSRLVAVSHDCNKCCNCFWSDLKEKERRYADNIYINGDCEAASETRLTSTDFCSSWTSSCVVETWFDGIATTAWVRLQQRSRATAEPCGVVATPSLLMEGGRNLFLITHMDLEPVSLAVLYAVLSPRTGTEKCVWS